MDTSIALHLAKKRKALSSLHLSPLWLQRAQSHSAKAESGMQTLHWGVLQETGQQVPGAAGLCASVEGEEPVKYKEKSPLEVKETEGVANADRAGDPSLHHDMESLHGAELSQQGVNQPELKLVTLVDANASRGERARCKALHPQPPSVFEGCCMDIVSKVPDMPMPKSFAGDVTFVQAEPACK